MRTRAIMKYRTSVERSTSVSDNGGGFNTSWASIADIPCYAWFVNTQEVTGAGERPGVIENVVVFVPKNTDIQNGDRLTDVTDRKGGVIFDGPLQVDSAGKRLDYAVIITRQVK